MANEPPTEDRDAFDTLGLDPDPRLTRAAIERAYLVRIAAVHPDHGVSQASSDDDATHQRAAMLNHAKRALQSAEVRANLVLARLGGPSAEQLKDLPEGWLASIMQTRMAMEEELAEGDPEAVERWRAWAEDERRGRFERVAAMLDAAAAQDSVDLRAVRIELNAWRYIERLAEQIPDGPMGRTAGVPFGPESGPAQGTTTS